MNEVEILNKIMQAFPQGSQGGNVVINIINTSNQQNNNISQSTSILNTCLLYTSTLSVWVGIEMILFM